MTQIFPPAPTFGTTLEAARPSQEVRDFLAFRRSIGKRAITAPGPSPEQLDDLLAVAARVPDHRRLAPWRFIVFEGEAREAFNTAAVDIQTRHQPAPSEQMLADTACFMMRAPVVIGVVSSPDVTHKTPVWEQELSAGALCHNLLLAANAAGWAGCWLSEWIAFDPEIKTLLGLAPDERMAGFIYLGTATEPPQERMRPDISSRISRWSPQG